MTVHNWTTKLRTNERDLLWVAIAHDGRLPADEALREPRAVDTLTTSGILMPLTRGEYQLTTAGRTIARSL